MADPPSPSPRPDVGRPNQLNDEPKTDPGLREALARHDTKLTVRSVIVAAGALVAGIASFFVFIDARIARAADAGIQLHESRLSTVEQQRVADRSEMNARFQRLEDNQNADRSLSLGTSQKIDRLLERFNVPNPAPAPKDGGQ